ncbi:MAG: hypothetical protein LUF35_13755, partial [Lachnospiraceae bacterium]|nr:hypothetical protein [Lachnospiraceae bacterium]
MKIRQLKRILSITVATAMLVTSIPVGSYADDMTPITEEDVGTGDDNESTSDDSGDSGDDNTGGDVGNSDSGDTGDSDSGDDGTSGDAGDSDSGDDGSSGDSEDSDSEDAEDSDGGDDGSSGDAEDTEDAAEADESADAEDTTDAEETVETTAAAKTTNKSLGSGLLASTPSLTGVEETVTLTWSIADGDEYEWSSTGVSLPTATVESGYTVTSYTYTWSDGSSEEEINNVTSVSALGTYTAKVTVTDDSSGDTVTVSNDSISFSIVMVKLYITYTQSEWTVTYDGNDYSGSLPSLGLETSDGTSIGKDTASSIYYSGLEVSCSDSLVDAGRYTVDVSNCTLGGDDAGYYDVANYDEMSSMTFVIEPKEVDITWSEENGTTIYTGSVITPPTATYVDIDEQTCGAVVSSAPETVQDVGEYTLTATISAGNYTASETTATTSFSVTKGSGTVTGWSSETLTYNGGIQYPKATVDVDTTLTYEVLDAESLSAVSTAVVPGVTYVVRVTSDNYELSNNVYEFTVDKKEITSLTWSSTSAAYTGSEISKPTATFVDVKGNSLNMDVSFADGDVTIIQDVRSYDLIAAFSSTTSDTVGTGVMMDQLYTITDDNATLTFEVTELEVEVSWSGDMSVAYDGTAHTLTPSVDSGFYTVTVESITKGEDGVNSEDVVLPGTYVFTASSDNDNITLTNNTATLEITKAQVSSFTWPTEMTAVYCNEKIELPTVTFDGVETDDDTIDATVEITEGGTTDGSMMNADTYELTASIPDTVDSVTGLKYSDLYEISSNCTTNTAEFTITPLEITLTADNKSRYYYAADPTWSYSVDGIPESGTSVTSNAVKDALTVSYKITDDDGEDMTTSSPVGSYTITLTATENTTSNYSITCNDGTLEIEELEISLTANLTSKTYGEKDPELTYEVTIETDGYEGISTDDIKAELGTILERSTVMDGATEADESDGENVGTYAITFI